MLNDAKWATFVFFLLCLYISSNGYEAFVIEKERAVNKCRVPFIVNIYVNYVS